VGVKFAKSAPPTDNTITAYRSAQSTESFRWETMKQISRSVCGGSFSQVWISPLSLEVDSGIVVLYCVLADGITPVSRCHFSQP
jgi:hypothetical protein